MRIQPSPPEVEGMPEPPCPLASLPDEILTHILRDVAILDVGDFVRLAQVCKRLAFLVATEDRIWRRICLGSEFGFGGMHYHWQRQITWQPLGEEDIVREAEAQAEAEIAAAAEAPSSASQSDPDEAPPMVGIMPLTLLERAELHAKKSSLNTMMLFSSLYSSSWQRMFRTRPRIRFNGCYISTVNYMRSGQGSVNQLTWNSPVHIVTYYRYLRFFRDGTALSLLTTSEPADVVHHMTKAALVLHTGGANPHLPSHVMKLALRGRWKMVGNYNFRLDLSLRSVGKTKNNKLVWRAFYNYNRLTDDWAEFALKNDKAFVFSRVKSYGVKGA